MPDTLRHALRSLLRHPRLSLGVVLPLALGLGAATALFSVLHTFLLAPLALPGADELVAIHQDVPQLGGELNLSSANYLDLVERNRSLETVAAYEKLDRSWTGHGNPERLTTAAVTPELWQLLGVAPAWGSGFEPAVYEVPDPTTKILAYGPAVLLSHELWQTRFGADPRVIGTAMVLDGRPHRIAGVMPPGLCFPEGVDVWTPLSFGALAPRDRGGFYLSVLGRRKAEAGSERVRQDLEAVAAHVRREAPDYADLSFVARPLREALTEELETALWVLFGLSLAILAGVVVNAATLLLAHSVARQRELAVRLALGGARRGVAAQAVAEAVLLALVAGVLGLLAAVWLLRLAVALAPFDLAGFQPLRPDLWTLVFGLGTAVAAGVVCGLLPVLRLDRNRLVRQLNEGGRSSTASRRQQHLQHLLVATQVALAAVLLVATLLMVRTYWELATSDFRFQPRGLLTLDLTLPEGSYDSPPAMSDFAARAVDGLAALPGAESAAAGLRLPVLDEGGGMWFLLAGASGGPPADGAPEHGADLNLVTPGFFETLRLPLLAGRGFDAGDRADAEPVVVVSQELVRRHFSDGEAVGRSIYLTPFPEMPWRIVGIAADVRQGGLRGEPEPALYLSYHQLPLGRLRFVVRTAGDPAALLPAARQRIWSLDPALAFETAGTFEARLHRLLRPERFALWLVGLFGVLGLVLSAGGIYGSTSYAVGRQLPELGIRAALGGEPRTLVRHLLRRHLGRALPGLAAGAVAVLLLARSASSVLYGVSAFDPVALLGGLAVLGGMAILAVYLPARRAARLEPSTILRRG